MADEVAGSGSTRTTTRSSACPRTPPPRRSRRPTASSRSSITLTRSRATPTRRTASRRSPPPTTLGDAEKRKAYDQVRDMSASGFGPGCPPAGSGGPGRQPDGRAACGTSRSTSTTSAICSAVSSAERGGGAAGRPAAQRGATSRRPSRSRSRTPWRARPCRSDRRSGRVRGCHGSGAEPGPSRHLSSVGGERRDRGEPGVLLDVAALPALRRAGGSWSPVHCAAGPARSAGPAPCTKIPAGVRNGARSGSPARASRVRGRAPRRPLRQSRRRTASRVRPEGRRPDPRVAHPYTEATLGANVEVPTLNGPVTLKVPAGTPSGKTFRVKGRGAPKKEGAATSWRRCRSTSPRRSARGEGLCGSCTRRRRSRQEAVGCAMRRRR